MKTALLLANAADAQQFFAGLLGDQVNLILLPAPVEPTREKFDALFTPWLRLADGVIIDAVSVGESTRWALESLEAARLTESPAVVIRATALQHSVYPIPAGWLVITDTDPWEQAERTLSTFLQLREAQARLKRADAALDHQRQAAVAGPVAPGAAGAAVSTADTLRYRDALKNIAHVLGQHLDENALVVEFLRVVRELVGVGKLAIFTRRFQNDLFTEHLALEGQQLAIVGSSGIARTLSNTCG